MKRLTPVVLVAFASLLSVAARARQDPGSDPFEIRIQQVAAGVYLAYRPDPVRVPVDGNVTVIVNDADVVVVDAGANPIIARRIIARVRQITDKPVRYLVDTDWHGDHTVGNAEWLDAYPGLEIVGHHTLLTEFRENKLQYVHDTADDPESSRQTFRDAVANGQTWAPPVKEWLRRFYEEDLFKLADAYRAARLQPPTMTIGDGLRLLRGARTIEIRHLGFGDTRNDAIVHLPEQGIVATGDMLTWPIPFGYTDSPLSMVETLRAVAALEPRTLIPGHGKVLEGTVYLQQVIELFDSAIRQVRECVDRGLDVEATKAEVDLAEQDALFTDGDPLLEHLFDRWLRRPLVPGIYQELTGESGTDTTGAGR